MAAVTAARTPGLIGYRRVSTVRQLDGYGLPTQEKDLRAYARRNPVRLLGIETDGARSGTLAVGERPGLAVILQAIAGGKADGLLLPGNLDRLARELTVQEAVLAQVWRLGGEVYTTLDGLVPQDDPDDPMRTAMRQMAGVFAQLDRALVIKRLKGGRRTKSEQGGYAGYGSPAFGTHSVDKQLAADPAEQAAISRMVALRAGGASIRAVCATLNAESLPSKRGGRWHPQTVARVLARLDTA
jgi:DNA invertase Pin-like site-specific DNA recombinase